MGDCVVVAIGSDTTVSDANLTYVTGLFRYQEIEAPCGSKY